MVLTLLGGVLLLGVFLLFGHLWGANTSSVALAGKLFVPVWLAVAIYLDIFNLFLSILRLFGLFGSSDD